MTKRSSALLAISAIFLFGAAIVVNVQAASCGGVETAILNCSDDGEGAVKHILLLILEIMTMGVGVLATVGISIAGIQYLTAAGDVAKTTKAKRRLLEIVIGLACYAVLWAVAEWLLPGGVFHTATGEINGSQDVTQNQEAEPEPEPAKEPEKPKEEPEPAKEPEKPKEEPEPAKEPEKPEEKPEPAKEPEKPKEKPSTEKKTTVKTTVKKNVIIILGASQVRRIAGAKFLNLKSYTSKSGKEYKVSDETLNFIYESGTGFSFQSVTGWKKANAIINKQNQHKSDVTFYVFFTLVGNDIKNYACSKITTSNQFLANQMKTYNSLITEKQREGYSIKGYVTSAFPIDHANSNEQMVVKNSDKNYCAEGYRSNYKYKLYNGVMKEFVSKQKNLSYIETFDSIMDSNFKFTKDWQDYKTTDGRHWDNHTAQKYFNFWMGSVNGL